MTVEDKPTQQLGRKKKEGGGQGKILLSGKRAGER